MRRHGRGLALSLGLGSVPRWAVVGCLLVAGLLGWAAADPVQGNGEATASQAAMAGSSRGSQASRLDAAARRRLGLVYLQSRYSTYFDPQMGDRTHNIKLAAGQIDGILLQPDQEFSFNACVGERSAARGFRAAPVLVGGELVDGLGGGICQLSTTLYNVALLAGLQIRQRVHHSRPLGYVPAGRDATVYDGLYDLRFVNDRPDPVLLTVEVVENRLTAAIWGPTPPRQRVDLLTTDQQIVPAAVEWVEEEGLPTGAWRLVQSGWDGLCVKVYRRVLPALDSTGAGPDAQDWDPRGGPDSGSLGNEDRQWRGGRLEWVSTDLYPPRSYRIEIGPGSARQEIWTLIRGVVAADAGFP